MARLRRTSSPLEDDDLLEEILLRLPPQPSSLPRASAVCNCWAGVATNPTFLRRFRAHHRTPPLLGLLHSTHSKISVFTPVLDPPDRVPAARFSIGGPADLEPARRCLNELQHMGANFELLGCRHGLALLFSRANCCREAVVWDPLTGHRRRVDLPRWFWGNQGYTFRNAALLCAAAEDGHVHGACQLSPFKLALVCNDDAQHPSRASAHIYDSASGEWGDAILAASTQTISTTRSAVLVGNALCWMLRRGDILELDIGTRSLVVIQKPVDALVDFFSSFQILRTKDGGLGLAILSDLNIQLWEMKRANCVGAVRWVLQKTIQLGELFSLTPSIVNELNEAPILILGYDEDANVIFLHTDIGVFMLQLESMQFRNVPKIDYQRFKIYYPYTNFYTTGRRFG